MIEFKAEKSPKLAVLMDGRVEVTLTTTKAVLRAFEGLKDKDLTVSVKEYRQKRSLSQNAYLWVLLEEIGKKMDLSKEAVYKTYVKDYGVFEIIPVRNEAAASFITKWQKQGIGWFCEDLGESKLDGYTKLIVYFGSSSYNTEEMKRLLDAVLLDCKEVGIETMSVSEIMLLRNDN